MLTNLYASAALSVSEIKKNLSEDPTVMLYETDPSAQILFWDMNSSKGSSVKR